MNVQHRTCGPYTSMTKERHWQLAISNWHATLQSHLDAHSAQSRSLSPESAGSVALCLWSGWTVMDVCAGLGCKYP